MARFGKWVEPRELRQMKSMNPSRDHAEGTDWFRLMATKDALLLFSQTRSPSIERMTV